MGINLRLLETVTPFFRKEIKNISVFINNDDQGLLMMKLINTNTIAKTKDGIKPIEIPYKDIRVITFDKNKIYICYNSKSICGNCKAKRGCGNAITFNEFMHEVKQNRMFINKE